MFLVIVELFYFQIKHQSP